MRSKTYLLIIALVAVLCLAVGIVSTAAVSKQVMDTEEEQLNVLIATKIYGELNEALGKPLIVAEAMSSNDTVLNLLKKDSFPGSAQDEARMMGYLNSICKKFKCDTAFIISDANHAYYTNRGFNKVIDPKKNEHDTWYSAFVDSDLHFSFDVDTNEVDNSKWTAFVNYRVEDEDGRTLGVCGVGIKMSVLQQLLGTYETDYNATVSLVDKSGVVRLSSDSLNLDEPLLGEGTVKFDDKGGFIYTKINDTDVVVTKYVSTFDWFIVVNNSSGYGKAMQNVVLSGIVIYLLFVVLLFSIGAYVFYRSRKRLAISMAPDPMTGLLNKADFERRAKYALSKSRSSASFFFVDMDHFKDINDNLGHTIGDEAICTVAKKLQASLRKGDLLCRWGGDEFCILLVDVPKETIDLKAQNILKAMRMDFTDGQHTVGASCSIGICYSEKPRADYEVMLNGADKALYEAKEAGRDCCAYHLL